jgi:dipeptidyl aminopeptidase/acylaminoacyl peptidase
MRKSKLIAGVAAGALVLFAGAGLFLGDYVYTSGTKVPCEINADDLDNTPQHFYAAGYNSGPFPGEGWNKWVGHDLSDWWLPTTYVEDVRIDVADGVTLAAWYIEPKNLKTNRTVIVTHGIGTSKRDFNTLLPTSMLVKGGFNVLLVDQRDTGESTCTDGRHSAGQEESSDFAEVAKWLNTEKGIPASSIGMFGVSGGAIATSLLPAKTDLVSAFAMEGTIFDFNAAATKEVEFQGYPGFLWQMALISAQLLHGVNLTETAVTDSIAAAGDRPMLILHGDKDQRLDYQSSVDFYNYAKSVGVDIKLETFVGADHTEGMLSETDRYAKALVTFFDSSLR